MKCCIREILREERELYKTSKVKNSNEIVLFTLLGHRYIAKWILITTISTIKNPKLKHWMWYCHLRTSIISWPISLHNIVPRDIMIQLYSILQENKMFNRSYLTISNIFTTHWTFKRTIWTIKNRDVKIAACVPFWNCCSNKTYQSHCFAQKYHDMNSEFIQR